MATGTAQRNETSLAKLRERQRQLLTEQAELMARGEAERLRGQPTSTISARLNELADELGGVLLALQQAERENGDQKAAELPKDREFQAIVRDALGALEPLVNLADAVHKLGAAGLKLEPLPRPLAELVAATKGYTAYLRRKGVLPTEEA